MIPNVKFVSHHSRTMGLGGEQRMRTQRLNENDTYSSRMKADGNPLAIEEAKNSHNFRLSANNSALGQGILNNSPRLIERNSEERMIGHRRMSNQSYDNTFNRGKGGVMRREGQLQEVCGRHYQH